MGSRPFLINSEMLYIIVILTYFSFLPCLSADNSDISIAGVIDDMLNSDSFEKASDDMGLYHVIYYYLNEYIKRSEKAISFNDVLLIMKRIKNDERLLALFIYVINSMEIDREFAYNEKHIYINSIIELSKDWGDYYAIISIRIPRNIIIYTCNKINSDIIKGNKSDKNKQNESGILSHLDKSWIKDIDSIVQIAEKRLTFNKKKAKSIKDEEIYISFLSEIDTLAKEKIISNKRYREILNRISNNEHSPESLINRCQEYLRQIETENM